MKRELKELKQQKADLMAGHGKRSPSPKTNGFIKENEKLQVSTAQAYKTRFSPVNRLRVLHKHDPVSHNGSGFGTQIHKINQKCFSFYFSGFLRKIVRNMKTLMFNLALKPS